MAVASFRTVILTNIQLKGREAKKEAERAVHTFPIAEKEAWKAGGLFALTPLSLKKGVFSSRFL